MPLDSTASAAMHMPYLSMYNGQAQMASSIGGGVNPAQAMSEGVVGGLANRSQAMGAPLLQGAMGMLGLDPISMGFKAMSSAWGGGAGALGAGAAGIGAMAGVGVAAAGVGYMGNQVYTGMAQQQALQQTLRANYGFMRPGGQGFDTGQMGQIGATLREMTSQFGPSGEVTGFRELTQLAGKMSQMGMAQGVRDVQDFSRRFKDMVSSLKTMAKDLGTTLEGAMEFASAAKGSGIFGMGRAQQFAVMTKGAAAAGGLAMSEVTSMANIGSQISRSVGGLGRAGAVGGVRTIEQLGVAQQLGLVTEEGIYNATGLTGAEGRQAFATSMMERSARFLSGGRGRRFLASVAGKGGQLDADSISEYLSGGDVSTGRTMDMAHRNLAGVGRAGFLRNEGRLRGEVLGQLGGLAMPMVYKQWLSERGYDPTSMDDKSKLAFQRFSGLGRDEADEALTMVQNLPKLAQEMRERGREFVYNTALGQQRGTRGIEGAKKKFEQVRERVNSSMQQVGQNILNSATDQIERWMNSLTDSYTTLSSKAVNDAVALALKSGDTSKYANLTQGFSTGAAGRATGRVGDIMNAAPAFQFKSDVLKGGDSIFRPDTGGAPGLREYTTTYRTDTERREAYGTGIGRERGGWGGALAKGALWGAVGAGIGSVIPFVGTAVGATAGFLVGATAGILSDRYGAESTWDQARGQFMESDESMALTRKLYGVSTTQEKRQEALATIRSQLVPLENQVRKGAELSPADRAKYDVFRTMEAGEGLDDLVRRFGPDLDKLPPQEKAKYQKRYAMSVEQAATGRRRIVDVAKDVSIQQQISAIQRTATDAMGKRAGFAKAGFYEEGMLRHVGDVTSEANRASEQLNAFLSQGIATGPAAPGRADAVVGDYMRKYKLSEVDARKMLETMKGYASVTSSLATMGGTTQTFESDRAKQEAAFAYAKQQQQAAYAMTPELARAHAKELRELGAEAEAEMFQSTAIAKENLTKLIQKKGAGSALNAALGISSGADAQAIAREKDPHKKAILRLKGVGIDVTSLTDEEAKRLTTEMEAAQKSFGGKDLGGGLQRLATIQQSEAAQKAQEKKEAASLAAAKARDPIGEKMLRNSDEMVTHLRMLDDLTPAKIAAAVKGDTAPADTETPPGTPVPSGRTHPE